MRIANHTNAIDTVFKVPYKFEIDINQVSFEEAFCLNSHLVVSTSINLVISLIRLQPFTKITL